LLLPPAFYTNDIKIDYWLFLDELYKLPNAALIAAQQTDMPALSSLPTNNNIPPTNVSIVKIICKDKYNFNFLLNFFTVLLPHI